MPRTLLECGLRQAVRDGDEKKQDEIDATLTNLPDDCYVSILPIDPFTASAAVFDLTACEPDNQLRGGEGPPNCYVTLLQMAAIVGRGKRTMRRLYDDAKLPPPAVEGTGGKASEWIWDDVRPILEAEYSKVLPAVFPADRFVRS
jgi:hypothetical protein